MALKTAIYMRVSTADQSVDSQRQELQKFIERRDDLELVGEYADVISGTREKTEWLPASDSIRRMPCSMASSRLPAARVRCASSLAMRPKAQVDAKIDPSRWSAGSVASAGREVVPDPATAPAAASVADRERKERRERGVGMMSASVLAAA